MTAGVQCVEANNATLRARERERSAVQVRERDGSKGAALQQYLGREAYGRELHNHHITQAVYDTHEVTSETEPDARAGI